MTIPIDEDFDNNRNTYSDVNDYIIVNRNM